MQPARSEARRAAVLRLIDARASGLSQRESARAVGIPEGTLYPWRTEAEIRADLARQLEVIVRRFEAGL